MLRTIRRALVFPDKKPNPQGGPDEPVLRRRLAHRRRAVRRPVPKIRVLRGVLHLHGHVPAGRPVRFNPDKRKPGPGGRDKRTDGQGARVLRVPDYGLLRHEAHQGGAPRDVQKRPAKTMGPADHVDVHNRRGARSDARLVKPPLRNTICVPNG